MKKRKKSSRMHGRKMGTHGGGARKKRRDSGHRGGKGMSGTGKRSDQKKTKIIKIHGHGYFGKKGHTSKSTIRNKNLKINLGDIQNNYSPGEINLTNYKILGNGELKNKFTIKAASASSSAIKKIEASGGKIILPNKEKTNLSASTQSVEQKKKEIDKNTSEKENNKEDND